MAGRHLGNPVRWPEIFDYHNNQVGRSGDNNGRVFRIKDPNRIYAGQILYLPIRDKRSLSTTRATGDRHKADNTAIPIDMKIKYSFGYDEKPLFYLFDHRDNVISAKIKGIIAIELISPDRYVHNLELMTAKSEAQLKQKLNEIYNKPFCALTAKPEMEFRQNNVTLKFPANNATYSVNVSSNAPRKMTGSFNDFWPILLPRVSCTTFNRYFFCHLWYRMDTFRRL